MTTPVLVAVPGPAESGLVAGWESLRREVVVSRRCADLAEVMAAAGAGLGRAVVLGADLPGADAETVDALRRLSIGLVVLLPAGRGAEEAEHRWRQLGATAFARADDAPAAVARAVREVLDAPGSSPASAEASTAAPPAAQHLPEPFGAPGRTVAVWGPHGSSGRTTLAVNLAAELAQSGSVTLVVDLDTRGAAVGQALGLLDEAPGVLAAVRAASEGRLDAAGLTRTAPVALPGLSVLSGAPDPARWAELRPVGLRRVLEVAAVTHDWVVLDLPGGLDDEEEGRGRDAVTRTALEAADVVLVVGGADPVGLQRWIRAWTRLGELAPQGQAVAVVNRVRASAVGAPPERRVTAALRRFAGAEDVVLLPEDPVADVALLAGRTLAEVAGRSGLRRAVQALAVRLERSVDLPPALAEDLPQHGFDPLLAWS